VTSECSVAPQDSFNVKDNVGRTQLVYQQRVNETTCFGLLGGHHQVLMYLIHLQYCLNC